MNNEVKRKLDELWKKILKYKIFNRAYKITIDKMDRIFTLPTSLFSLFAGSLIGTLSGLATGLRTVPPDRFGFLILSILLMILSSIGFLYIYLRLEDSRRKIKSSKLSKHFKSEEKVFLIEIGDLRVKLFLALVMGIISFLLSISFLIL
jgi:hypothetical protein